MTDPRTTPGVPSLFVGRQVSQHTSYELWARRKGTKDWKFQSTPSSTHAEQRIWEWAKNSPDFEFRLERTIRIREKSISVSA